MINNMSQINTNMYHSTIDMHNLYTTILFPNILKSLKKI